MGDLCMALPAIARLKRSSPNQDVILIVRPELVELAQFIRGIDCIIPFVKDFRTLRATRQLKCKSAICFFEKRLLGFLRASGAREIWALRDQNTPHFIRGPMFHDIASLPISEMLDSLILEFLNRKPSEALYPVKTPDRCTGALWDLSAVPSLGFDLPSQGYAVIHMSGRGRYRRLSLETISELKHELILAGLMPVFTGTGEFISPEMETGALNLVDKTSLTELLALLAGATLVFGPDTGVTHLSSTLGKTTLVMMGSSQPRLVHSHFFFPNQIFQYSGELACRSTKKLHGYLGVLNAHCKGFVCSNREEGLCVNDTNQQAYILLARDQIRHTNKKLS
jgi:hypothetical protein